MEHPQQQRQTLYARQNSSLTSLLFIPTFFSFPLPLSYNTPPEWEMGDNVILLHDEFSHSLVCRQATRANTILGVHDNESSLFRFMRMTRSKEEATVAIKDQVVKSLVKLEPMQELVLYQSTPSLIETNTPLLSHALHLYAMHLRSQVSYEIQWPEEPLPIRFATKIEFLPSAVAIVSDASGRHQTLNLDTPQVPVVVVDYCARQIMADQQLEYMNRQQMTPMAASMIASNQMPRRGKVFFKSDGMH